MATKELCIERDTPFNKTIEHWYQSIPAGVSCWQAKEVLYHLNQKLDNPLWFGGGASHIWICLKSAMAIATDLKSKRIVANWEANRSQMPERIAIIYFRD